MTNDPCHCIMIPQKLKKLRTQKLTVTTTRHLVTNFSIDEDGKEVEGDIKFTIEKATIKKKP